MKQTNLMKGIPILLAIILSATIIAAHPSIKYLPAVEEHVEYTPAVVGHTVHSIPTAVSHQSQTIVHEKRPYLRPIVEHHTPIIKTYTPYVKKYTPIIKSYEPRHTSVAWPPVHSSYPSLYHSAHSHGDSIYDGWSSPHLNSVYGGWSSGWKPTSAAYDDWNPWALKK